MNETEQAVGRPLLRQRRKLCGLSRTEAAQAAGVVAKTWTRWETGETEPQDWHRKAIARALAIDGQPWDLTEVAVAIDPLAAPDGHTVPEWLDTYAGLEQGARRIWTFQPLVIPGLLQTRDYAHAVERADAIPKTDQEIHQRVELRIARQGILIRDSDPLQLAVVLDESSLHRVAGNKDVMADQLKHLVNVGSMVNVEIRVLPFSAGEFSAAWGAFSLLASGRETPTMAFVENRTGMSYLSRPFEIDAHKALFDHLCDAALPLHHSSNLIHTLCKEIYQ